MSINIPSGNPANLDSLGGAFRQIFSKFMQKIDGMLPAQVVSYTAGPPATVKVQPMISILTTGGDLVQRAQIASVPVLQLGGGGFIMNFPLVAGDLGWILANDRDISLFLQSYDISAPGSLRVKNFGDAIFIPHKISDYDISGEDTDNFVIQNLEGTVKISVSQSVVNVVAPTVNINGGTVNLSGDGGAGVARIGDSVVDGIITSGSTKVFSN